MLNWLRDSIDVKWSQLKGLIEMAEEKTIGHEPRREKNERFTEEYQQKINDKNVAYKQY